MEVFLFGGRPKPQSPPVTPIRYRGEARACPPISRRSVLHRRQRAAFRALHLSLCCRHHAPPSSQGFRSESLPWRGACVPSDQSPVCSSSSPARCISCAPPEPLLPPSRSSL